MAELCLRAVCEKGHGDALPPGLRLHGSPHYAEALARTKYQIAFYGSTPIYAKALEAEGWGDLHPTLRQMTRENRWMEMGQLITDEMCERFAVVGEPKDIGPKLVERFGPWVDRLSIMTTYRLDPEVASQIVSDVRTLTAGRGS